MNKVWQIAVREFVATVFTKGFIIGLLIFPTIAALMVVFGPRFSVIAISRSRGRSPSSIRRVSCYRVFARR